MVDLYKTYDKKKVVSPKKISAFNTVHKYGMQS